MADSGQYDYLFRKPAVPLKAAQGLADKIVESLAPHCERIEVAGSIRRRKETVGDIEIVAIPKTVKDLFGTPFYSELDPHLGRLIAEKRLAPEVQGDKYKRFLLTRSGIPGFKLDLFLTTWTAWGYIFAIRTGNSDFSKAIVTPQSKGGLLCDDVFAMSGRLWTEYNGKRVEIDTPEEPDLWEYLSCEWLEPEARSGWRSDQCH